MGSPPSRRAAKKCAGIAAPALYSPNGLPIGEQPLLTVSVVSHANYINLAGAVSIKRANISTLGENANILLAIIFKQQSNRIEAPIFRYEKLVYNQQPRLLEKIANLTCLT